VIRSGEENPMESTMRHVIALAVILPVALAASAASAAGTGKYCLKGPGKTLNCQYQTMAACDKVKKGSQTCVSNPSSTTGMGTSPKKY
jgi:hypothetical protein